MGKLPSTQNLSLEQKVGQLFMPAAFINDGEEDIQKLEKLIKENHVGSICFFHSRASAATNFEGKKEVIHNENSYQRLLALISRYQKAASIPLVIAIDAEWGLAMRIENTPQYPYAITLGAIQNGEHLVFQVGKRIAQDCQNAGIHWNLSPVVDINLNPENPVIGYRSFGDNKKQVTAYARAYIEGMSSAGILNSIKHFPGHGDTATDSHLGLPLIDKTKSELLENELYPFIALMDSSLDAVMVGHLSVPSLSNGKKISSSVSRDILTEVLRDELGWNGIIISDALNMHAVSKDYPEQGAVEFAAFEAGNDILCFADDVKKGMLKILKNCSPQRIEESFERFWQLKKKALNSNLNNQVENSYNKLMVELASASLTLLHGDREGINSFQKEGFAFFQFGQTKGVFLKEFKECNEDNENVLLSIVPKQVKPKNNFGFTENELKRMNQLLHSKNVLIYLFGNPFVLNLIPWLKAKAVVIAYQDFPTFQQCAIDHFNGKIEAQGKLPVTLKTIP